MRTEDRVGAAPDWDRQGPSSQATAGSSGRSDPRAEPQDPLARQRELNRRAQVRFRQRQRARREAAMAQYQEVRASLEAARAEKRALARQNVLLARLLEHRDRSLGLLQSGAGEAPPSGLGLRRLKPCCLRSEDGFSPAQMALLHADCLYGSSNFFTMPGMALPPKDVQRMRELGPEPVLRMGYWLKQELASLIESLDVAYSSEKEARLNSVLATGTQLGLSADQWANLRLIGEGMRVKLRAIVEEQRRLQACLTEKLACQPDAVASLCGSTQHALEVRAIVDALDQQAFEERDIYCRTTWGIFWGIFRPVQKAKLIVLAEGTTPIDVVRVMDDLDVDHGPVAADADSEEFRKQALLAWDTRAGSGLFERAGGLEARYASNVYPLRT
ncbi:hypothetical protein QBZ16_000698 [Prototheca wickerhamii]|uniref:BZIP domain-containing protein n=1 Tax=Prototheca wickerhamii TaxID=3111 RepID=A0AAD9INR3_PROWI|nr:hypothetical protein QBZ16_000698 [Prototheca wickerhamii]